MRREKFFEIPYGKFALIFHSLWKTQPIFHNVRFMEGTGRIRSGREL